MRLLVAAAAAAVVAAAAAAVVGAAEDIVAAGITARHPCRGRRVARRRRLDQLTGPARGRAMAICRRPAVGPRRELVPPPAPVQLRAHVPVPARDREHYLLEEADLRKVT